MKKLFRCKLLSMLLALTLLFAGAVSLKPTQKANADTYYSGMIRAYVLESLDDLEIVDGDGRHVCIIADKYVIEREGEPDFQLYQVDSGTDIEEVNNSEFMQALADVLAGTVDAPPLEEYLNEDGLYDCAELFSTVDMDLLVWVDQYQYINFTTGHTVGLENASHLITRTNTTYDSIVYGLLDTAPTPSAMHILFTRIQQNNNFYMTSFHALDGANTTGAHYTIHTDLLYGVY